VTMATVATTTTVTVVTPALMNRRGGAAGSLAMNYQYIARHLA